MIYNYNKLNKNTKNKILNILKAERAGLAVVTKNKNYIELSKQSSANLDDAIDKSLYILKHKTNHEKDKKYIILNKNLTHFVIF